jgi:hypothetical protein
MIINVAMKHFDLKYVVHQNNDNYSFYTSEKRITFLKYSLLFLCSYIL